MATDPPILGLEQLFLTDESPNSDAPVVAKGIEWEDRSIVLAIIWFIIGRWDAKVNPDPILVYHCPQKLPLVILKQMFPTFAVVVYHDTEPTVKQLKNDIKALDSNEGVFYFSTKDDIKQHIELVNAVDTVGALVSVNCPVEKETYVHPIGVYCFKLWVNVTTSTWLVFNAESKTKEISTKPYYTKIAYHNIERKTSFRNYFDKLPSNKPVTKDLGLNLDALAEVFILDNYLQASHIDEDDDVKRKKGVRALSKLITETLTTKTRTSIR